MSEVTGVIHVGGRSLLLEEGNRPAWLLGPLDEPNSTVWIPTIEDMLEDGVLMAGLLVEKDAALVAAAAGLFRGDYARRVELYDDLREDDRHKLHGQCRKIGHSMSLLIVVLGGSTLAGQVGVLEEYGCDVELCQSVYRRAHSDWVQGVLVSGSLSKRSDPPRHKRAPKVRAPKGKR